jgi:YHS domain-containing protein
MPDEKLTTSKDPICGMDVPLPARIATVWNGASYAFCSAGCKSKFDANPSKYLSAPAAEGMPKPDFTPLFLIFLGIVILSAGKFFAAGEAGMAHAMYDFVGFFFVVFAGFKLMDVKGFAEAYATYDILAKKSRAYALAYPFIELGLGVGYLFRWNPGVMNWTTLLLMSVSSIGVLQAIRQKRKIQCACLGTKIKLPMTKITLFEDLLMVLMALAMILSELTR